MIAPGVESVLHVFLSRLSVEKRESLLRFLPDMERDRLAHLPAAKGKGGAIDSESLLERVHWSWFLPTLKTYTAREQSLFLSALEPAAADALEEALACKAPREEISPSARHYLRQLLLDSLHGPHDRTVPIDYLPPSPLNRLLKLSKKELAELIDLLAMHDLSVEIRQIVETKILKKIYSFLTKPQRQFLKQVAGRQELSATPRMGLDRWDGSEETLRHLFHRRGLMRLGAALRGEDASLVWTVCHQLDIGRGNALFKLIAHESAALSSEAALKQVEELLHG